MSGGCLVLDASWWEGHSEAYLSGLLHALDERNEMPLLAVSPELLERVITCRDPGHALALRRVTVRNVAGRAGQLRAAYRWATQHGATVLIDAYADLHLTGHAIVQPRRLRSVHVLHSAPGGARHATGRLRRDIERLALRRLARRGHSIVVHTERARQVLERIGVDAVVLPVPIRVGTSLAGTGDGSVLHVGGQSSKGLDTVLALASDLPAVRFVVTGAVAGEATPNVSFVGRLPREDLLERMAAASAVLLPYAASFVDSGAASVVGLEALACGSPVVASMSLAAQLPSPGVVPLDEDLRRAGATLLSVLSDAQLRSNVAQAATQLRARHSFTHYVDGLLEVAR